MGNETSDSIKCEEILDLLRNDQVFKKGSIPGSE